MKHINELQRILSEELGGNKARIECLSFMVMALFSVRTVNLTQIANASVWSRAKIASRYRRMQRLLCQCLWPQAKLARFVLSCFNLLSVPLELSIDRTNWKWGKANINIFMLSVVYKGVGLPILWLMLPKQGNSTTTERIELLERFTGLFGHSAIACLLADREFVGVRWFRYLCEHNIPFVIRVKENFIATTARGLDVVVKDLFHGLKPGEQLILRGKRRLLGSDVYLIGACAPTGSLWILASRTEPELAVERYARRWQIETLFHCLKGRGFRFEDTHIIEPERISALITVLVIGFCWAHRVGEWRHQHEPIRIKKHRRRQYSFFRYGLDYLQTAILSLGQSVRAFKRCLSMLSAHSDESLARLAAP